MEVTILEVPTAFWLPDTNSIAGSAGEKIEQVTIPKMFHKMQNISKNASPLWHIFRFVNVMCMHVWRGVGVHIYLIDEWFVVACA